MTIKNTGCKNPLHPGAIIAGENGYLAIEGISVEEFSNRSGIHIETLKRFLNCEENMTHELEIKFKKVFPNFRLGFWMNIQDKWEAANMKKLAGLQNSDNEPEEYEMQHEKKYEKEYIQENRND